jgi:amidohydrolase
MNFIDELAITGLKADIKGRTNGPKIGILGEMDSVVCYEHPDADLKTGAVHACGHYAQLTVMLAVAMGLKCSGVMRQLAGNVSFLAVPAEEFIDLEFRSKLKSKGKIKYFSGKQEFVRSGVFDDIDIVTMMHLIEMKKGVNIYSGVRSTGFLAKRIKFTGKEAHAGALPYEGINSLNAAVLAINAINANRETFKDEDNIRVHSIITKGGDAVNIIPGDVRLEMQIRGNKLKALEDANNKVNRSIVSGAMAVGAEVEIHEIPGYLPFVHNEGLIKEFIKNSLFVTEEKNAAGIVNFPASFDFGDISHLKPGLHPFFGGVKGGLHTKEFKVIDKEKAYIEPAKILACTIIDLLADNADKAKSIIRNFKPKFSKDQYLKYLDKKNRIIFGKQKKLNIKPKTKNIKNDKYSIH